MIIYLTGADFSTNKIGTINTWSIFTSLGSGATYSGPTYVDKNAELTATVTIDDGYEIGSAGISVMMGSADMTDGCTNISGNTISISISPVTGNVTIKVPTVNTSTGEEDSGNTGGGDESGSDAVLNLTDYATYIGCITGSTNTMQYSGKGTGEGNMFYQIPISDFTNPDSVTVVAGTSTKAYVSFFTERATTTGVTPPYASGHTAQTILDAGASQTFTIPSDAVYMYVLATNGAGSSLRPASVTFHNATYKGSSDPAGVSDTGTAFGTTWVFGSTVSSSGSLSEQPTYAATLSTITRESGKNLKYTPYTSDANGLWLLVATYMSDGTFIERKAFDPSTTTSVTTITLDDDVAKIRLGYGRSSSTEIAMTQESLDYLNLAWV